MKMQQDAEAAVILSLLSEAKDHLLDPDKEGREKLLKALDLVIENTEFYGRQYAMRAGQLEATMNKLYKTVERFRPARYAENSDEFDDTYAYEELEEMIVEAGEHFFGKGRSGL